MLWSFEKMRNSILNLSALGIFFWGQHEAAIFDLHGWCLMFPWFEGIFDMMTKLFIEKWQQVEPNFVDYFKKEWLGSHSNWFKGAAQYTPSTNNALESHNATIKRTITFRRRLPLEEFLAAMITMTATISKQLTKRSRIVKTKPKKLPEKSLCVLPK